MSEQPISTKDAISGLVEAVSTSLVDLGLAHSIMLRVNEKKPGTIITSFTPEFSKSESGKCLQNPITEWEKRGKKLPKVVTEAPKEILDWRLAQSEARVQEVYDMRGSNFDVRVNSTRRIEFQNFNQISFDPDKMKLAARTEVKHGDWVALQYPHMKEDKLDAVSIFLMSKKQVEGIEKFLGIEPKKEN